MLELQMGPSGSGKTTLLDLLAGRKTVGKTAGSILFAGNKPTRPFLRRFTGYVEQFGELTALFRQFQPGQHGCMCVCGVSLAWMQASATGQCTRKLACLQCQQTACLAALPMQTRSCPS